MKSVLQIIIMLLILGCSENNEPQNGAVKKDSVKNEILTESAENEFKPDSSYEKFWCSGEILKETFENIDKLELIDIAKFLATFNKKCSNNVEYSEWSNELLFEVANRKPELLLQLLEKNSSLDKELIKSEFENPIYDEINLEETMNRIKEANSSSQIRNEIIESLEIAKSLY